MHSEHSVWVLLVGAAVVVSAMLHALAHRIRVPALVGCLLLGMLLRWAEGRWWLLGDAGTHAFSFLADIGLVAILFRVGLHSDLQALLAKLRPAALIWMGNVVCAGFLGYFAARYLGHLSVIPSLFVAVALTATSIGIAAAVWEESGALQSPNGQLMIDVAELDDISGVLLMALLFALVPAIHTGNGPAMNPLLAAGSIFVLKFGTFAALCWLTARYVERPLTRLSRRLENPPERMLPVAGVGFMIAATAGALGFSLAIGALFAGLVFSRDPEAVRDEARFDDLYAFFSPFFFVGIGLNTSLDALASGAELAMWLLIAAVSGKVIGTVVSAPFVTDAAGTALISASMIPRAEIAMVVVTQGRAMGWVPDSVHAAMVMISAVTCILAPWILRGLFARWPQRAAV